MAWDHGGPDFRLRFDKSTGHSRAHIQPEWLIPQFRDHALEKRTDNHVDREGQQQVLRATFPGIRDSVKELIGMMMDALPRKFHETHDMKVKDEIERLARDYGKLKEP
jgi:hypothetical protein